MRPAASCVVCEGCQYRGRLVRRPSVAPGGCRRAAAEVERAWAWECSVAEAGWEVGVFAAAGSRCGQSTCKCLAWGPDSHVVAKGRVSPPIHEASGPSKPFKPRSREQSTRGPPHSRCPLLRASARLSVCLSAYTSTCAASDVDIGSPRRSSPLQPSSCLAPPSSAIMLSLHVVAAECQ
ncbi:hypothetical protein K505DRAFT_33208 [Melanomma pulvis-pyrius CBS 109.77]|uniref:Uncharacterized protein n=1 Tax=Melanomma pulvis-pyrius CBS 109.77 TaxID=1314802 RepID=A0A6A6XCI3_9PLEO|nr:hypothetical protein K505DRAFT_33208 [Melanomma pulvis-pyrius CBS 109.77]